MSISGRFRHLERARPAGEEPESAPAPNERFGQIAPAEAEPAEAPQVTSTRFEAAPAPVPESPELEADSNDQPFVRCCRCEGDNNAHATKCMHCGSSLETLEQRTYNDRLWAQRLEERRQEQEQLAAREKERAAQAALEEANRRLVGERLAREVAEQYRAEHGWSSDSLNPAHSVGRQLLEVVPPKWKGPVLAVAIGTPLAMLFLAPRGSMAAFIGFFWLIGLVGLFAPPAFWKRRRRRWWDD